MTKMNVRILSNEDQVDDIKVEIGADHKPNVQIYQQGNSVYAVTDEGIRGFSNVKELTISFED